MTYRIRRESFSDVNRADYNDVSVRFVDGKLLPAVCVKIPGRPYERAPADVRKAPDDVRDRTAEWVKADWWTLTPPALIEEHLLPLHPGRHPHSHSDGRSMGWLVVHNIGTPDEWTETQLAAWKVFETAIEESIKQAEKAWHAAVREEMSQ